MASQEQGDNEDYVDDGQTTVVNNQQLTAGTVSLNLSPSYVKDWTAKHAYCEVLQNQ